MRVIALFALFALAAGVCTPDDNYANCGCEHASCQFHEGNQVTQVSP